MDFCRRGPLRDLLLAGVLRPVPVSVKSDTPSSRARRGVWVLLAILDFGESRCLDDVFAKCDDRFPPYDDFEDILFPLSDFLSGVKGDEWLLIAKVVIRVRGEGVNGIRPPAVRVENMPVWDFMGVDTAVAMLQYRDVISVERQINVSIDDWEVQYIERAPRDST